MKPIKILLVDDNKDIRRAVRTILEREEDFDVVGEAKNGNEAVAMVKDLQPEMVLMDVSMPLLDGFQATSQILKFDHDTKVIMHSSHADEAYVNEALKAGAMGYLIKPNSADHVCGAIREVYKGHMFFSPTIPKSLYKQNLK